MRRIALASAVVLLTAGPAFAHTWVMANFGAFKCEPAVKEGAAFVTPFTAYETAKEQDLEPTIFIASRINGQPFKVEIGFHSSDRPGIVTLFYWRAMHGRGMAACKKMIKTMFDPSGIN